MLDVWKVMADSDGFWAKTLAQLTLPGDGAWIALVEVFLLSSLLLSVLLIQISGYLIRQGTVVRALSRMQSSGWEFLFSLRSCSRVSKRYRRRLLRTNPIFWLQQRTWSVRATKWGWCGFILAGEVLLLAMPKGGRQIGHGLLGLALMVGLTYASACSYRLEKRNGILELILLTSLPPWRLVTGRVRSLWVQLTPAILTWAAFGFALAPPDDREAWLRIGCLVFTALMVTPVVGVDCAANFHGHWRSVLITAATVFLAPAVVFLYAFADGWAAVIVCCAIIWIVGLLTAAGLHLQMTERRLRYLHPHRVRRSSFVQAPIERETRGPRADGATVSS